MHTTATLSNLDATRLFVQTWLPDDRPVRAIVAVVHGWSDHSGRYGNLVNALLPHGVGVCAVDLRGHGQSEGQRGHINTWAEYRTDVQTFLNAVAQQHTGVPLFLFGHSMGGAVCLDYVLHHPQNGLQGLLISSPLLADPAVSPFLIQAMRVLSRVAPRLSVNPGADPATISRDSQVVQAYVNDPLVHSRATPRFSTELDKTRWWILSNVDGIRVPFLLLYGEADGLVPPHVSRELIGRVGAVDKTAKGYAGSYHELINDINREDVLQDIIMWLNTHIPQD